MRTASPLSHVPSPPLPAAPQPPCEIRRRMMHASASGSPLLSHPPAPPALFEAVSSTRGAAGSAPLGPRTKVRALAPHAWGGARLVTRRRAAVGNKGRGAHPKVTWVMLVGGGRSAASHGPATAWCTDLFSFPPVLVSCVCSAYWSCRFSSSLRREARHHSAESFLVVQWGREGGG